MANFSFTTPPFSLLWWLHHKNDEMKEINVKDIQTAVQDEMRKYKQLKK